MTKLFQLLGKSATSPEAREILARYPRLRLETEDAGPGDEDAVRYLRSEADGLLIKLSADGEVRAIFLMGEGKDGFAQFHGELPVGFGFHSTRREVLQALGAPAYSRAGGRFGNYEVGELMRFDWPAHSVHFQFRRDGRGIELVTAMTAAVVPGRSQVTPE